MRKTFLYLLGGQLASLSIPAMAQDMPPEPIPGDVVAGSLTPEQLAEVETWPPEKRAQYEAWPTDAQAYYWTLTEARQDMFWMLRDEDKLSLVAMDDPAREEAWTMIEGNLATPKPEPKSDAEPDEPADNP